MRETAADADAPSPSTRSYTGRVNPRHRRYIIPVALAILILISVVAQIIGK